MTSCSHIWRRLDLGAYFLGGSRSRASTRESCSHGASKGSKCSNRSGSGMVDRGKAHACSSQFWISMPFACYVWCFLKHIYLRIFSSSDLGRRRFSDNWTAQGSRFDDSLHSRPDGAVMALLRDLLTKEDLIAVSTHLYWNPNEPDVKVKVSHSFIHNTDHPPPVPAHHRLPFAFLRGSFDDSHGTYLLARQDCSLARCTSCALIDGTPCGQDT